MFFFGLWPAIKGQSYQISGFMVGSTGYELINAFCMTAYCFYIFSFHISYDAQKFIVKLLACSETTLTGESQFHISTPMVI
jgi:hypothetical protein